MGKMKQFTVKEANIALGRFVYRNTLNGEIRKRWWTKARVPGTVRKSRMPGGGGFRNNWEGILPALLLAVFLSSCLWASPGMAKGDYDVGLSQSGKQGVYNDPCGDTSFATRFYNDSVHCLTSMGPLTFHIPTGSMKRQKSVPFLIDNSWYFAKAPIRKEQERFHKETKPFDPIRHLGWTDYLLIASFATASLILIWVTLNPWEAPFEDDKENLV